MRLRLIIVTLLSIILCNSINAQNFQENFQGKKYKITKTGMTVLGSWALGNIAANALMLPSAHGDDKYFKQMNIYWNLVNIAIAGGGYVANEQYRKKSLSTYQLISDQYKTEKVLLLNAGLDLVYITAGQLLKERAKNISKNPDRLKGFGNGLILQGVFLFVFDLSLHTIHIRHRNKNNAHFSQINLSINSDGLRMYF
ncbi:DUF6992 family protein [Chondrinema litorale]|uniref:DUF6992 family protein n=1 Tax=Chondrinema litorale TaxID=2994555 RepID=UPI002542D2ED|nr:hypothetical protein [Chondrinema litorale]UZR94161.1 hypothetical protein OQ292_20180 [Chondrinema litorale]